MVIDSASLKQASVITRSNEIWTKLISKESPVSSLNGWCRTEKIKTFFLVSLNAKG